MNKNLLHKFYKKSLPEKITTLFEAGIISEDEYHVLLNKELDLPSDLGEHMIENYIGNYSLPLGTALNFVIDEKDIVVPMAIEEPSVIAAASFAAKIISKNGGFTTKVEKREMIGQVALKNVNNIEQAKRQLLEHKENILERANAAHPSIVKRGGGARDIEIRYIGANAEEKTSEFLVVHVHVDAQEAMGANMINTMMEGIAPYLEKLSEGTALMRILSNYSTECLATASCKISPNDLKTLQMAGEKIRDRIIEASKFAWVDPYRAVTNNKGIMNGIDAVVIATGNDWRAVEAGAHAYASNSGQYRSLTKWRKDSEGNLVGTITLPLPVGTVGGSIGFHPGAALAHNILENPTAKQLEGIIASVGLAQNFAAIRALVTEGIQKGHMGLQARSLAISAGAKNEQIEQVAEALKQEKNMNLETAKRILKDLNTDK